MSVVYASRDICSAAADYIIGRGHTLCLIESTGLVYPEISTHADVYMCRLGAGRDAAVLHAGAGELGYKYPQDVAFNAVCLDKYFIHRLDCTAPRLAAAVKDRISVNVRQGYTKCSTLVVDGGSIITADDGIAYAMRKTDVEVLHIRPVSILLKGFESGFIGGASGRVGNSIVFNGDITEHPDAGKMLDFIRKREIQSVWFEGLPLTDIGSIIQTNEQMPPSDTLWQKCIPQIQNIHDIHE